MQLTNVAPFVIKIGALIQTTKKKKYNSKDDTSPFKFADTDIEIFYHTLNNENYYERTFERAWIQKAFVSDMAFDEFIDNMVGESFSSSGNDDWKEAAWQRKLRRQNKVNLRRRKR